MTAANYPITQGFIEYKIWDGTRRRASLTATDVSNPGVPFLQNTNDSQWVVTNIETGEIETVTWMFYWTNIHLIYQCRTHCTYNAGITTQISVSLEHKDENGNDDHSGNGILFIGWDNGIYQAVVQNANPGSCPQFIINPV